MLTSVSIMIFIQFFFVFVITFAVDIPCVLFVFIYELPTEDMMENKKIMTLWSSMEECAFMGMTVEKILSD